MVVREIVCIIHHSPFFVLGCISSHPGRLRLSAGIGWSIFASKVKRRKFETKKKPFLDGYSSNFDIAFWKSWPPMEPAWDLFLHKVGRSRNPVGYEYLHFAPRPAAISNLSILLVSWALALWIAAADGPHSRQSTTFCHGYGVRYQLINLSSFRSNDKPSHLEYLSCNQTFNWRTKETSQPLWMHCRMLRIRTL